MMLAMPQAGGDVNLPLASGETPLDLAQNLQLRGLRAGSRGVGGGGDEPEGWRGG